MIPDVSVLLVTFNHESYIRRALDSVFCQITTRSLEVVVADDNSTDATVAIIRAWAGGVDIPVLMLAKEPQLGITGNYRRGFAACRGRFVVVLEGDDEWISIEKIDRQAEELDAHPHLSMVANRVLFYDETRSVARVIPPVGFESTRGEFLSTEIAKNNWFATFSCCMYRSEALRRIPAAIFETTSYDWAINMAVTEYGPAGFLPRVMTLYRQHSGGQWSKLDQIQQDQQLARLIPDYVEIFGSRLRHELMRVLGEVEARLERSAETEAGPAAEAEVAAAAVLPAPTETLAVPRITDSLAPRVSVVMACHNNEDDVLNAVTSVLYQSIGDLELIVVDDGSSDDSARVLTSISDPRLRVYSLERSYGAAAALNLAIQQTRAEFVAVIEPTARWEPIKLHRQLEKFAEDPQLGAVFTAASVINGGGDSPALPAHPEGNPHSSESQRTQAQWLRLFFTEGNPLCHSSVLIRRAFYEEHGLYDNRIARQFDFERWLELIKHLQIVVLGGEPLVRIRVEEQILGETGSDPSELIRRDFVDHVLINESFFDGWSTDLIVAGFGDLLRQRPDFGPGELDCERAMLWLNTAGSRHEVNRVQAWRDLRDLENDPVSARLLLTRYGFDDHALQNLGQLVLISRTPEPNLADGELRPGASGQARVEETSTRQLVSVIWTRVKSAPPRRWMSRVRHQVRPGVK